MRGSLAGLSVLAAMVLAGCTGSFNIDQTEPIRIQLEGDGEDLHITEGGGERRVAVDTQGQSQVTVDVQAESKEPATIVVQVQDAETRTVIVERTVVVQPSQPATQSIDVDVRGNKNIVIVTQSTNGDATVNIAARGTAVVDNDDDMPTTTTTTTAITTTVVETVDSTTTVVADY